VSGTRPEAAGGAAGAGRAAGAASGWGKPKNRFGMLSSTTTLRRGPAAAAWRVTNSGAITGRGNSKGVASCAETVGGTAG